MTPPSDAAASGTLPADSARERLLTAGLRLFAHQGFAPTSTRELAEAAQVNVAAISYYFGDKAGLYRAVFFEPMGDAQADVARIAAPGLTLAQALRGFFAGFLEPLRDGDEMALCMKLHFREMLEPTGLWAQLVDQSIRPVHDALVALLQQHLGVAEPDEELLGLAVCITALGVHLHVGHEVTAQVAPQLAGSDLDRWSDRLVRLACAMVEVERLRRQNTNEDHLQ
jgi:TetR/AcrR family transcriptional regulator, regulator of cefoperazone and chloramphenicol sensitivity